ncbi:MAG: sel1 repeat family protein [Selenomonadaceae bacterium]|nr:sel1 repeat family protein [Selenomonadaceae bacterium]
MAENTAKVILEITGAQLLAEALAPVFGLGPKKTDEEKQKDKEMEKAQKEQEKEEKKAEKDGTAVEDPTTPIGMVKEWAEKGDVQAQCILSYAYETGQKVPKDPNLAMIWQNRAADQNIPLVKNFLPLEYGKKVIPLARLFAISGRRSHVGQYVDQNVKDAVRWSQLGADEKDTMAIAYIASAYYTGRGMPQDYKKAIELAKSSDKDPLSLEVLIQAYQWGNGVDKDQAMSDRYARYLKTVVERNQQKEKDKMYKKYEKEIKAGDLYGIIR